MSSWLGRDDQGRVVDFTEADFTAPAENPTTFDIRAEGAIVGAADNSNAINNSILAARKVGGTVVIPGKFNVGGLLLQSRVRIDGLGYGCLRLKDRADTGIVNFAPGASRCSVVNLEVDGNKANQTEHSDAFGVVTPGTGGVGWSTVAYCWIHDVLRTAVYMEGPHNAALYNTIEDIGNTTGVGRTGIVMSGENTPGGHSRVIGNDVSKCTEYCIKLYADSDHAVVGENVLSRPGRMGIYVSNCEDVSLPGNTIDGAPEHGMLIQANAGLQTTGVAVSGGSISGGAGHGLSFWGVTADGSFVRGCSANGVTIHNNAGEGVNMLGAPGTSLAAGSIRGNGKDHAVGDNGVLLKDSPDCIIGNVPISNNGNPAWQYSSGISTWGSLASTTGVVVMGTRIWDDQFTQTQKFAISSANGAMDYWSIGPNDLRGNKTAALALEGLNNQVHDNMGVAATPIP